MSIRVFTIVFTLSAWGCSLYAADVESVLNHVPKKAGFVLVCENPRGLVESLGQLPAFDSVYQLPQIKAALEQPDVIRAARLLKHVEKELGAPWPDLIHAIAGNGIAFSLALKDNPPALLVLNGTDETKSAKALAFFIGMAAGDGQTKVKRETIKGTEAITLGKDFFVARVGKVIYLTTKREIMVGLLETPPSAKASENLANNQSVKAARDLADGSKALVWGWLDFASVKATPQGKEYFATTRSDFVQTMLLGSTADAALRSDFLALAFKRTEAGLRFELKLPAKRSDLPPELEMHVPPIGKPGSLPLLEPEGVTASLSMHLDLAKLWQDRTKLLNDDIRGQIEKFEKDISRVLPGTTFGKLMLQSGPYHRFVAVHTSETLYATKPGRPIPPPAWVMSMRDPELAQSLDGIFRASGLIAGLAVGGMSLKEQTIQGVKVVSYTFNEKPSKPVDDPDGIRFNFVPCFATIGESFVISGSPGVLDKLIPELTKPKGTGHPAAWRAKIYARGTSEFLKAHPDPLITETVLERGIGLADAKVEVDQLLAWVRTLGFAGIEIEHGPNAYTFSAEWNGGTAK